MRRMLSMLSLYQQHSLFMVLVIVMFLTMGVIQLCSHFRYGFFIEDLMTIWLTVWMSLAFLFGIIIKRQTANPLAHLLPGYKKANALLCLLIWGGIAALSSIWLAHIFTFISPSKARMALGLLCAGTFLLTTMVAYVSIRIFVLIAYALLLLAVAHVMNILDLIIGHPMVLELMAGILVMLLVLFIWRIGTLREESYEYSYLLSWPLYKNNNQEGSGVKNTPYTKKLIPSFSKLKNRWSKTQHWASVDSESTGSLVAVVLAGVVIYEFYVLKIAGFDGFYMRPYANLFLYTMLPVFITLFSNHRLLAYKDWASMLPLRREELVRQWGDLLAITFLSVWVLVSLLLIVIPGILLGMNLLNSIKMWEYLLLTGVLGYMTLTWFCYLALEQNSKKVIGLVLLYVCLVSFESVAVPYIHERALISQIIIFMAVGIWYRHKAYQQWGKEEEG